MVLLIAGDAGENNAIKTLLGSHSRNVQVSSTKGGILFYKKAKELLLPPPPSPPKKKKGDGRSWEILKETPKMHQNVVLWACQCLAWEVTPVIFLDPSRS